MNIIKFLKPKSNVAYIYENSTLRQGIEKMKYHRYTAIPVISQSGKYVGTVTEGDFLLEIIGGEEWNIKMFEQKSISDILRKGWNPPLHITDQTDILAKRITEQNFVPIVDDREMFVGIITRKDVILYLTTEARAFVKV